MWRLRELEPGDVVIANKGTTRVLAVGTVVDPGYEWRDDRASCKHTVRVEWNERYARDIEPITSWGQVTVADVPNTVYQRIIHGGAPHGAEKVEDHPVPAAAVDPVFADIEDALERKGQVILYGPPGTGKTYIANRFAVWWLRRRAKAGDADQALATKEAFTKAEHELSTSHLRRRVWWVVANPAEWSWDQLFTDGRVDYRYGKFKKNYASLSAGDLVVGYQANPDKRIMALAQVSAGLHDVDGTLRITLEPITKIANGMSYEELTKDPVLAVSEPIRARNQGTLFALSEAEATYVPAIHAGWTCSNVGTTSSRPTRREPTRRRRPRGRARSLPA